MYHICARNALLILSIYGEGMVYTAGTCVSRKLQLWVYSRLEYPKRHHNQAIWAVLVFIRQTSTVVDHQVILYFLNKQAVNVFFSFLLTRQRRLPSYVCPSSGRSLKELSPKQTHAFFHSFAFVRGIYNTSR